MEKILVAVDGYDASMGAAKKAVELSIQHNAELIVIKIEEEIIRHEYEKEEEQDDISGSLNKISSNPLDLITEYAKQKGLTVQTIKTSGIIAGTILRLAEEHNVDFIVVGDSARTGLDKIHFGSIATSIVTKANVPVIVVRNGIIDISDLTTLAKQFTSTKPQQASKPVFDEKRFKKNFYTSFSLLGIFAVAYFGAAMLTTAELKHIAIFEIAGIPLAVLLGTAVMVIGLVSTQIYLKKSIENNKQTESIENNKQTEVEG